MLTSDKRSRFTREFGADAVKLVTGTGRPVAQVAAEIGVGAQLLGRWSSCRGRKGTSLAASMRRQRLQIISPRRFTPITTIADRGRPNPADPIDRAWQPASWTGCGPRTSSARRRLLNVR